MYRWIFYIFEYSINGNCVNKRNGFRNYRTQGELLINIFPIFLLIKKLIVCYLIQFSGNFIWFCEDLVLISIKEHFSLITPRFQNIYLHILLLDFLLFYQPVSMIACSVFFLYGIFCCIVTLNMWENSLIFLFCHSII